MFQYRSSSRGLTKTGFIDFNVLCSHLFSAFSSFICFGIANAIGTTIVNLCDYLLLKLKKGHLDMPPDNRFNITMGKPDCIGIVLIVSITGLIIGIEMITAANNIINRISEIICNVTIQRKC